MSLSRDINQLHPREVRRQFRQNNLTNVCCSEYCACYVKENIACLPSNLADDFEQLCKKNSSAFPLLYRSQPGEVSAPPLASDFDVRTDLPIYAVLEDGVATRHAPDVLHIPWEDMVTFYYGCSFSFDHSLLAAKVPVRHMIEKFFIPIYLSNIPFLPQGSFTGNMIVSLRTIPREFVQKVVEICVPLDFAHGAPIHIGDPRIIGIEDILQTLAGDRPVVREDDVMMFWACGTNADVVASAKPPIAVALSPACSGSQFITDLLVTDCHKNYHVKKEHFSPKVVFLSDSPQFASLVSQEAIDQITKKQMELQSHKPIDIANGDEITDDLLFSAMTLSHATSVAIATTGISDKQLAAVVCITKALFAQEKEVVILAADNIVSDWKAFVAKCQTEGVVLTDIPVMVLAANSVVDSLGPNFYSTSHNSVVVVNDEGKIAVRSLLSLGEDSIQEQEIKIDPLSETSCWLHLSLVTMATFILHTCPVHTRYVRRGRGEHNVKAAEEFFVSLKQMESLGIPSLYAKEWIASILNLPNESNHSATQGEGIHLEA